MADSAVVGILRALLTADTAQFDAGMRKAVTTTKATEAAIGGLGKEVGKLTPLAERMVKGFGGDKLLYTANSLTMAVNKLGGAQKLTESNQARVNKTLNEAIEIYRRKGDVAPKAMLELERATRKAGVSNQFFGEAAKAAGVNTKLLTTSTVALAAAAGSIAAELAGRSIRAVISMGKEAFTAASALTDLSAKTGIGTESLQRLDAVAGQAGFTVDAFAKSSFTLGNRLAGGGDSVRAAVDDLRRASGDLRVEWVKLQSATPDARLLALLTALSKVKDETERNRIGTELFGKSFETISAGIVDNFEDITRAARVSSDAQIQALDVAADRWDQFVKDRKADVRTLLGDIILAGDEMKRRGFGGTLDLFAAGAMLTLNPFQTARAIAGMAGNRQAAATKKSSEEAAQARQQQTKAEVDYVAVLREAQGELKKLDAAERRQILAAQEAGAEQEALNDLVVKYGGSSKNAEIVLKLLNGQMKDGEKAAKDLAKAQKELNEQAARAAEIWFDVQVQMDRAMLARQRSPLTIIGDLNALPDLAAALAKLELPRSQLTIFGDLTPGEAAVDLGAMVDQLEEMEAPARRLRELFEDIFAPIVGGVAGAFGELFTSSGKNPRTLRGILSAEEYTRAMREFESRWDRFLGRLGQSFKDMLSNMLQRFINEFLGGILRALAASALGQRIGAWLGNLLGFGGGGISGQASSWAGKLFGFGGGGATTAAATTAGTSTLTLAPGFEAGLNAAAGTTTAAGGGGGASGFAGFLSQAAPPIAIGFGLYGLGRWLASLGTRPAYNAKFPPMNIPPRSFQHGGFVPPNVTMPAILHGGSHGELITPVASMVNKAHMGSNTGARTVVFQASFIDHRGVREFVKSKEFTDSVIRVFDDNTNFVTSRVGRALRP